MKKLLSTYLLNIIAAMALMMTAAACVDDTDLPEVAAPGTSVTIRIPNPAAADAFARSRAEADSPANAETNVGASGSSPAAAASRAEEKDMDTEAKEGDIHSLWLLAYNTDNSDYNVIRQLQSSGQLTHEYSEYRIEFKPGKYRIYVVANLDKYITGEISASTEESYLEKLILNFSPEKLPNTTDGLPMACLPAQVDGADTDGNITVEAGTTKTIQTDLTFLCAKVRYTILFDNSEGGFSREAFGSSTVTFNTASLTGVRKKTPLTDAVNALDGAFEVDPIDLKVINDSKDLNDLADPGFTPSATGAQRAWQGTMYLPENLLTGARTILHLGATLDANGAKLSYTVKLPKNGAEANDSEPDYTLTRGHFYDLVGRVTTIGDQIDITASVADWTLQVLTYDLHGPYFLHVDKTEIKVTAGVETLLMYDTDAPTLGFESPKYGGTNLDLFQFKPIEQDGKKYISVTTNPAIPAENNRSFDSYFYIKAANLYKRIEVNPVSLEPFLNVSPTEIEINIAEYIASGDYDAEIPIEFTTNLPSVTITQTGGDWSNFPITVEDITTDGTVTYNNTSTRTNTLKITGFNNGIWTSEQKFQLTYTAPSTDDKTLSQTVNITVKPNILDYIIHLRVPSTWKAPHIYVYQCLQIPQTRGDEYVGKTVGYRVYNDDGTINDYYSALEYSFTGKIAFRGWDGTTNNPKAKGDCGVSTLGFFVFDDNSGWNPNKDGFTNRYYNTLDFCEQHRNKIPSGKCDDCKNSNYARLWPGILMHDDGDDWWTFKLTGVATPGKALIMFNDGHTDNGRRYPTLDENSKSQPGIPLFDYPSREGWFDLAGGATQFSPTKPGKLTKFRLEWGKANNLWKISIQDANTGQYVGSTSENGQAHTYADTDKFRYDFVLNENVKSINVTLIDGNNASRRSKPQTINISDFGNDNPRHYWINNTNLDPNIPTYTYRIYWKDMIWDRCHVWATINGTDVGNPSAPDWNKEPQNYSGTEQRNGTAYRYFQFSSQQNWYSDKYSFIIYQSDNTSNSTGDQRDKNFLKNNSGDSSYDYYYEYN